MKHAVGNIWSFHEQGYYVVIPTNIGWTGSGHNVMGRGVAHQASQRFPNLAKDYGQLCKEHGANIGVVAFPELHLVLFPVKPLNLAKPHLSWQGGASLLLIDQSVASLATLETSVSPCALPLVGCGNGKQDRALVLPILETRLSDTFTLVELKNAQ
jgi:hypothetical protein